ncbi:MAG: hypothetical protein OD811_00205 [Alphaproteobacteria bacterium]
MANAISSHIANTTSLREFEVQLRARGDKQVRVGHDGQRLEGTEGSFGKRLVSKIRSALERLGIGHGRRARQEAAINNFEGIVRGRFPDQAVHVAMENIRGSDKVTGDSMLNVISDLQAAAAHADVVADRTVTEMHPDRLLLSSHPQRRELAARNQYKFELSPSARNRFCAIYERVFSGFVRREVAHSGQNLDHPRVPEVLAESAARVATSFLVDEAKLLPTVIKNLHEAQGEMEALAMTLLKTDGKDRSDEASEAMVRFNGAMDRAVDTINDAVEQTEGEALDPRPLARILDALEIHVADKAINKIVVDLSRTQRHADIDRMPELPRQAQARVAGLILGARRVQARAAEKTAEKDFQDVSKSRWMHNASPRAVVRLFDAIAHVSGARSDAVRPSWLISADAAPSEKNLQELREAAGNDGDSYYPAALLQAEENLLDKPS